MDSNKHISDELNHLFRQESGKMVSVLAKIFGTENLQMAEDVVQDALLKAFEVWKFKGIPDNPKAWLYRTAKNKAIDLIRREKHSQTIDFSDPERILLTSEFTLATTIDIFWSESNINDNFLGMMFACCHPEISEENQITFILKSLNGFSTKEIARAFLTSEDTISKRLYRTKEYFRKSKTKPEIPPKEEITTRLSVVLQSIYLIFNEGYHSTHDDKLIRKDIMSQAMLLCQSLLENPQTQLPEAYALMALMCFHSARNESRLSSEGKLVLIPDQDRSKWNQELITIGNYHLNKAAFGGCITQFHFEAAIAYEHCSAKEYASTNWQAILNYYNIMLSQSFDPVIFLNRSIVIMELEGAKEALASLNQIKTNKRIQKYFLFHATMGEIHLRLDQRKKAVQYFNAAQNMTLSQYEKDLLSEKILSLA